ncbi:MAG TPA: DUF2934 domain-containing protein [Terracidiphilus sp.]|nr:DUF2934 domain-containing protein [Terracidiphilus sp.]
MADILKKTSTPRKPRATKKQATVVAAHETHAPSTNGKPQASHEEIARLAHRLWAERGRQHGHDAEDWLRAEQQLLGKAS